MKKASSGKQSPGGTYRGSSYRRRKTPGASGAAEERRRSNHLRRLLTVPAALVALLLAILLALVPPLVTGSPGGPARADGVNSVPEYSGETYAVVNGNRPFFSDRELKEAEEGFFFHYADLDKEGRAGAATACVGEETVDESEREDLGGFRPSGWSQKAYPDLITDNSGYVQQRGHLIMRYLGGSDRIENIVTMTSYCNLAMESHEKQVLRYVYRSGNKVLYRVTPVYRGSEKMARGILMEAVSLDGYAEPDLQYCVYYYNVQPGIAFDYKTGESHREK